MINSRKLGSVWKPPQLPQPSQASNSFSPNKYKKRGRVEDRGGNFESKVMLEDSIGERSKEDSGLGVQKKLVSYNIL